MNIQDVVEYLISTGEVSQKKVDEVVERHKKKAVINRLKTAKERYNELDKSDIPLEDIKLYKIEELKQDCTEAIYKGFAASNGEDYGFNEHDQANMTQQMILNIQDTDNLITKILWKTKSNGVVSHTKSEFASVIQDAKNHKLEQQQKFWNLEEQVIAATTKEEVEAVIWG